MELKEARYILAIARQGSIGKAAESLFISQPSLSKYLKNLENQLGGPLFYRRDNCYTPTYMGERYLHYAEQIAAYGEQWDREYEDISHRTVSYTHLQHGDGYPDIPEGHVRGRLDRGVCNRIHNDHSYTGRHQGL